MSVSRLLNNRGPATASINAATGRGYVYDADAETYIAAVEAADGQRLEWGVRQAISQFVAGCRADGIWSAVKASCILMGARTLTGALTPLVGTAPTNNNFVSGDYSRTTGLLGNGSTKYLNSNRNNNADPQNSFHMACYLSSAPTTNGRVLMGAGSTTNETGASNFGPNSLPSYFMRCRSASLGTAPSTAMPLLIGTARASSGSFTSRGGMVTSTASVNSETPANAVIGVFAATGGNFYTDPRMAFYSIGESLTLATLESRVMALYYGIRAALL